MSEYIWLLDIDGVINAMNLDPNEGYKSVIAKSYLDDFTINYNPVIIDAINNISEKVSVVWCTTWGQEAVSVITPLLGLKTFEVTSPCSYYEDASIGDSWWKFNRFKASIELGYKVLWTDDDVNNKLLKRHPKRNSQFILRPDYRTGLTMNDIEDIRAWISL